MLIPVCELRPGDLVDLEGDLIADPDATNPWYPYEYMEVIAVTEETPACTLVAFDSALVGFPPWHFVEVLER